MEQSCYNCMHSEPLHGFEQEVLICSNRSGYRGLWYLVGRGDPSTSLGAGPCARFRQGVEVPALPAGVRAVPLTRGKFALVDAADYADVIKHSWYATNGGKRKKGTRVTYYAARKDKKRSITMHRAIMDAKPGLVVDHINHDGLDNRRCNLRVCSQAENARNQRGQLGRSSRYKGVSYSKRMGKWQAKIYFDGRNVSLGWFTSETAAARAYNAKARELFGEFAYLNEV